MSTVSTTTTVVLSPDIVTATIATSNSYTEIDTTTTSPTTNLPITNTVPSTDFDSFTSIKTTEDYASPQEYNSKATMFHTVINTSTVKGSPYPEATKTYLAITIPSTTENYASSIEPETTELATSKTYITVDYSEPELTTLKPSSPATFYNNLLSTESKKVKTTMNTATNTLMSSNSELTTSTGLTKASNSVLPTKNEDTITVSELESTTSNNTIFDAYHSTSTNAAETTLTLEQLEITSPKQTISKVPMDVSSMELIPIETTNPTQKEPTSSADQASSTINNFST